MLFRPKGLNETLQHLCKAYYVIFYKGQFSCHEKYDSASENTFVAVKGAVQGLKK